MQSVYRTMVLPNSLFPSDYAAETSLPAEKKHVSVYNAWLKNKEAMLHFLGGW
jgi:hypothetical protein